MKKQGGLASVEFAIIAVAFMFLLLGAIEVSRMLFTWNTLDAVTQRAARVAAVCPANHSNILQVASFGTPTGTSSILPGFGAANLQIQYLGSDFNPVAGTDPAGSGYDPATIDYSLIRYVRVGVVNYQHQLAIPFISNSIAASPTFTSTIPSESLGFIPFDGVRTC